jgi:hypothetical protein
MTDEEKEQERAAYEARCKKWEKTRGRLFTFGPERCTGIFFTEAGDRLEMTFANGEWHVDAVWWANALRFQIP